MSRLRNICFEKMRREKGGGKSAMGRVKRRGERRERGWSVR